jgi:hypothetical protein
MPALLGDRALTAAERQSLARARKREALAEYRAVLEAVIEAPDIATARKRALKALVRSFASRGEIADRDVDVLQAPEQEERDDGAVAVDADDLAGVAAEGTGCD